MGAVLLVVLGAVALSACPRKPVEGGTAPPAHAAAAAPSARPGPGASAPLELPAELERYRGVLQASVRPFVRITGRPAPTRPWDSKFGGNPYFPKGKEYPLDAQGEPMRLLAQLNLAEVPDVGLFPRKGILQFFISPSDDAYGLDLEGPATQRNYRVIYFPEVVQDASRLVQDFGFATARGGDDVFPIGKEARLSFQVQYAPVALSDHHARSVLPSGWSFFEQFGAKRDQVVEAYEDRYPGNGHKMGGYAFFTQQDPRESAKYADYDVLLLQIDSDDGLEIMWGDVGVANFFVKSKDLKRGAFADVLYNWDCY